LVSEGRTLVFYCHACARDTVAREPRCEHCGGDDGQITGFSDPAPIALDGRYLYAEANAPNAKDPIALTTQVKYMRDMGGANGWKPALILVVVDDDHLSEARERITAALNADDCPHAPRRSTVHRPERDDDVATWLKRVRDRYRDRSRAVEERRSRRQRWPCRAAQRPGDGRGRAPRPLPRVCGLRAVVARGGRGGGRPMTPLVPSGQRSGRWRLWAGQQQGREERAQRDQRQERRERQGQEPEDRASSDASGKAAAPRRS
jgi:hypothetical protein